MTEAAYQSQMRATAARHGLWLFRNNVGACVTKDGRRITYGLMPGSADCIGWMQEAGFKDCRVEHLVGPDSMVIGIK